MNIRTEFLLLARSRGFDQSLVKKYAGEMEDQLGGEIWDTDTAEEWCADFLRYCWGENSCPAAQK